MDKNFYVTTPIYYASGNFHLGTAYTTIAADVIKRRKTQEGFNVFYLTGTDEHGEKIAKKAKELNLEPKKYVDGIVEKAKELWELLDIDYDKFIRTTDPEHIAGVQKIFKKLQDNGDIYKGEYVGQYCVSCETYVTDSEKCPDCGGDLKTVKEESYFFNCQKYVDRLLKHFEENSDFLLPISRKNEIIKNFIEPGLKDLAVSRTSFEWGIPVPGDEKHVIYVWIDALSNYITALGYENEWPNKMEQFWPADVQLMGKEIIRFHAVYWPMMLMALDLPLPKQLFAHGWYLMNEDKMSKSKGNVIYPEFIVENYGLDSLRYSLMREVPFGSDGEFTPETFINRYNSDLANDLGNLVSRTATMATKYFEGTVKFNDYLNDEIKNFDKQIIRLKEEIQINYDKLELSLVLQNIWKIISASNKLIDLSQPWILIKEKKNKAHLEKVIYTLLNTINEISNLIYPVLINSANKIKEILSIDKDFTLDSDVRLSYTVTETKENLFPRKDKEKEIEKIQIEMQKYDKPKETDKVTLEMFKKFEIKIGKIVEVNKHPNADKLYIFKVENGKDERQIISSLVDYYQKNELLNKKVVYIENIEPTNLRGELSEGFILTSTTGEKVQLLNAEEFDLGAKIE